MEIGKLADQSDVALLNRIVELELQAEEYRNTIANLGGELLL